MTAHGVGQRRPFWNHAGVRFGILGDLHVEGGGVTSADDRVVLTMLLVHANAEVDVGALIEAVDGDDAPEAARSRVRASVRLLRQVLPAGVIHTLPHGYRLELDAQELDALQWTALRAAADRADDIEGRRRLLRQALDLWRGPAADGIDGPPVRHAAALLDEQHGATLEDWAKAEMACGRSSELIAHLVALVARFPRRVGLRACLVTALHRAGRTADALAEHRAAMAYWDDELRGIGPPSQELEVAYRLILADGLDEALAAEYDNGLYVAQGSIVRQPGDPLILNADDPNAVAGEFIVVLRGPLRYSRVRAHVEALVDRYGGTISSIMVSLPAFGLTASDEQARQLAGDPTVGYVTQNRRWRPGLQNVEH
jgi:DNA-binding SARP family transcriptional activator